MKGTKTVILNDQVILNIHDCRTFLASIGLDKFQIEDFIDCIMTSDDVIDWKAEAKEWELDSARNYELRQQLICEVQDLADKLATGKGGTKVQYRDKFYRACEFYA